MGSNTYVLISSEIGGNEKVGKILNDVRVIKLKVLYLRYGIRETNFWLWYLMWQP